MLACQVGRQSELRQASMTAWVVLVPSKGAQDNTTNEGLLLYAAGTDMHC